MGGRIVELLNSSHQAAQAAMPWLLNGTLTPAEQRDLEAHLQSCAPCRDELARQRDLMALYAASPVPATSAGSDAAFSRLLARLDAQPDTADAALPRRSARTSTGWWRMAVALQTGVIMALGWTVWLLQPDPAPPDAAAAASGGTYSGLAASPASPMAGDAVVVFGAKTSETELRAALQRAGARIVDGPTAAGAYVLRFEARRVDQGLAALRAERAVERAESLSAERR